MPLIKLSTWNIGSLYVNFQRNMPYFESVILQHPQDVLCVQEFPEDNALVESITRWGNFTHFKFMRTSESHVHKDIYMGVAIFSKSEMKTIDTLQLPTPEISVSYKGITEYWHSKYFAANLCEIMNKEIVLITGHGFPFHRYQLENSANYRIIQPSFAALDTWVSELYKTFAGNGLYMAADFNIANPLMFMPFCRNHFFDAFAGDATRPSGRKTDAIFLPLTCEVLGKNNIKIQNEGVAIFDHNFISVEFEI